MKISNIFNYTISNFFSGDDDNNFYFEPNKTKLYSSLYFRRPLDYETKQLCLLRIEAKNKYDGGSAVTLKNISIIIVNRNDGKPKFINQTETYFITENIALGTRIFSMLAVDSDKENTVRYNLVHTAHSRLFEINKTSGRCHSGRSDRLRRVERNIFNCHSFRWPVYDKQVSENYCQG